jgi:uncharacterized protein YceK
MRPRFPFVTALAVAAGLLLAGLTGCSTLHSWVQASSGHPATAGASMTVPLGK